MRFIIIFLKGVKKGMSNFGHSISIIINTFLLILVYLSGVGITSIIARIVGKKFINEEISSKKSYWSNLNLKRKPIEEYYRQF